MSKDLECLFEDSIVVNYSTSEKVEEKSEKKVLVLEREINEGKAKEKVKISPSFILNSIVNYIKKNWIFLLAISLIWAIAGSEDYLMPLFNTPVVGRPLVRLCLFLSYGNSGDLVRFFTATYNGPVWQMTGYTFLIATVAKALYLIIMTGVIFPSIKAILTRGNSEVNIYKESISKLSNTIINIKNNIASIDIIILNLGLGLIIANFLTRNGKFDKVFILILLTFVVFKGIADNKSSAIYFIIDKFIRLTTLIVKGSFLNLNNYYINARVGLAAGFLLAIFIGKLGESASYTVGIITLIVAGVMKVVVKGEAK